MKKKAHDNMDRREFLRRLGMGAAAVSAATLPGCNFRKTPATNNSEGEVSADRMTYRTNPKTGELVSLLGYGCMRWPMMPAADGSGEVIDQEEVNRLVDYALARGIN